MTDAKNANGPAGTTSQRPRWEGPRENRPRSYLPAKDDPEKDRDAQGENLRDPRRKTLTDALLTRDAVPKDRPGK